MASLGGTLYSCDPCDILSCASDNHYGQFRLVSATDGTDLVFGPNHVYNKDQIKFYSLNGPDTTFFDYQTIRFPNTGYDSIVYVNFLPGTAAAYMRLNNNDTGTIDITYIDVDGGKCCEDITVISKFRFQVHRRLGSKKASKVNMR